MFGTHIDYPITQTDNNEKYVNTGADGEFSLAGSIFLDYQNSQAFTDFNSILYGHHMEKGAMFGDLENFQDEAFLRNISTEICIMGERIMELNSLLF